MKFIYSLFFALLGALLPGLAWAADSPKVENINPATGDTWTIYVFGNGYVVEEILKGVTLLMTGNDVFMTLLLFLATVGFLALAIGAGFDPGKNLLKMFTYIFVVWFVSYASTRAVTKVEVIDLVRDRPDIIAVTPNPPTQSGVPALVAIPAAVTSQIGVRLTQFIETYFSSVVGHAGFTISGAGGQFNLFNRMIKETDQFVITKPALKQSLSSYVANCVVPAIAMGRLQGTVGATPGAVRGVDALVKSTDFLSVLASAGTPSIYTSYFPLPDDAGKYDEAAMKGMAGDLSGYTSPALQKLASAGVLTTCDKAFTAIETDMKQYADDAVNAGSEAWQKAGILVSFEEAYSHMLSRAAAAGGAAGANFSRPSGFIMQQAALNTMSGTFREAAVQTGNNELMTAAALAQAEQQQKSAWVAGFHVFNNMMGYVFTVLQAFIFAITPIIVMALLIPGLGKTIFVNYAQILIWLTLWQPMLAIVNFIITLFGSEGFSQSIGNGLSASNKGIISERANDLVIAAQFLGTMVPLLTWGIVKGAMAFTEFISSGVGSAFASQAGAAAATGNLSMNNMSMDNTSMNKFNTMSSSAVGTQAVQASLGAGSVDLSHQQGGTATSANGSGVQNTKQLAAQAQQQEARTRGVSEAASKMHEEAKSLNQLLSIAAGKGRSTAERQAATEALSHAIQASTGMGSGDSMALAKSLVNSESNGGGRRVTNDYGVEASAGGGVLGKLGALIGLEAKAKAGANNTSDNSQQKGTQQSEALTNSAVLELQKRGVSESGARQLAESLGRESARTADSSVRASKDEASTVRDALSTTQQTNEQYAQTLSAMRSTLESQSFSGATGYQDFNRIRSEFEALQSQMPSMAGLASGRETMATAVGNEIGGLQTSLDAKKKELSGALAGLQGGAGAYAPGSAFGSGPAAGAAQGLFNDNQREIIRSAAENYYRAQGMDDQAARIRADTAVGAGYLNATTVDEIGSGKGGLTQWFDRASESMGGTPSPKAPPGPPSAQMKAAQAQIKAAEAHLKGMSMAPTSRGK